MYSLRTSVKILTTIVGFFSNENCLKNYRIFHYRIREDPVDELNSYDQGAHS